MENKIKVVELFAGVGGFRLGLEGWNNKSASSNYKENFESSYEIVWSNQWEPSTKVQHASMVYETRWDKKNHCNQDISTVEVDIIPDHDLLVGGFPCQDYSVATTLKNSKGLLGKKGVLWWSIHKILSEKENKIKYLFLENVDRLLISPSGQRGRDFAIILKSLNDLGYAVEWRVVNAAEYGMPQRRKRIFILAYLQDSTIYNEIKETTSKDWILNEGTLVNAFPIQSDNILFPNEFKLKGDIVEISENFNKNGKKGMFENTGIMIDGIVTTIKTKPSYEDKFTILKDIIQNGEVTDEFYINEEDLDKWFYLKGAKKEMRKNAQGFEYNYSEGGMIFPDPLDKASRTIITGEGGKSASRFKHVIKVEKGYRRLSPVELERLNMFPDNHTKFDGVTDTKRAFFMGNALVVGVIEKIGIALNQKIKKPIFDTIS
ncbi:cytosine methyltransferase [Flavobacterium psychrophilum]|uniref:Cytosine-specific methyltransferase n=1 Tax=Flavobacterium psychrophilum (strain ATCC 49511 / DSM 21280 / CIP 103535 / JIP02/86) TaxID=402612 RepID=A6GXL6_FLAPJ|nr:DNA (cytosine-5-)-methyltransferase [Flavobacterium psychrophilum]AIG29630.1 cytosine methyltransferase [Flavobacterium psychrophilum]AIG31907.1 cytosine methyltransferase [Flavobacterium psychrophilum]AIG34061.1 cytosine methyltransferase [Flavobacterium psychrophilum]AIG36425.1 cytosine methyltransferase [Flavobacterium psychrophilum]AIG38690.1 cytosine methyltransferase [Flavobacterium psychrophilum]